MRAGLRATRITDATEVQQTLEYECYECGATLAPGDDAAMDAGGDHYCLPCADEEHGRRVMDSDTGAELGTASPALAHASYRAGVEGHVLAYVDDGGVWQHVPDSEAARVGRVEAVRRVYVTT